MESIKSGIFQVKVSDLVRKRRAANINRDREYRREMFGSQVEDNISWENVLPLSIPVTNYSASIEVKVMTKLKSICVDIRKNFHNRLSVNPCIEVARSIFHSNFEWYTTEEETDDTSGDTSGSHHLDFSDVLSDIDDPEPIVNENFKKAQPMMQELMTELPEPLVINLDLKSVTDGFLKFVETALSLKKRNCDIALETIYEKFYIFHGDSEDTKDFRTLFEKIQIKTYTESFCETIGSVMKIAVSKNRQTHPSNFNDEMFFTINSPPLHQLKTTFAPTIVDKFLAKNKRFHRVTEKGSISEVMRLKGGLENVSSSLTTFRKDLDEKSKLPKELFL